MDWPKTTLKQDIWLIVKLVLAAVLLTFVIWLCSPECLEPLELVEEWGF